MSLPCASGRFWQKCENAFLQQHAILWAALSRTGNVLIMVNVSLFFLTGQVTDGGYRFPVYSLGLLAVATLMILLPLGWHDRLWYYLVILCVQAGSGWLLGASVVYWLNHSSAN